MASALRQRCLIHRCRNVMAEIPAERHDELKSRVLGDLRTAREVEAGAGAVAAAQANIDAFARRYGREFFPPPSNVCWPTGGLSPPTSGSHQSTGNASATPTSSSAPRRNPTPGQVIGRLLGEASCLTLVWAVLDRASRGWRGLTYTPAISPSCATDSTNPATPTTSPPQLSHKPTAGLTM